MANQYHSKKYVWTSSVVIMPPHDQWKQFVDIKKNHMNPKIKRPPFPHITLLAPFVDYDSFDEAAEKIRNALIDVEPFDVEFAKFELFENNSSSTLYLDPEVNPTNAITDLHQKLDALYPDVKSIGKNALAEQFEPHIGVGYFRDTREAKRLQAKYQSDWVPIKFQVKEIYILSRISQDSPFEVRRVIPLGRDVSAPYFEPKPL